MEPMHCSSRLSDFKFKNLKPFENFEITHALDKILDAEENTDVKDISQTK